MHNELDGSDHLPVHSGGDTLHEECGVIGIFAPGDVVAKMAFFGLFALQHRGQESAGIAVSDGKQIRLHKEMGLVNQVFDEETLARLQGHIAIGHVRYSTTGSSVLRNAQPLVAESPKGLVAIGHNGNLVNTTELREKLEAKGVSFETTNDSEVIAKLIAYHYRNLPIEEAVIEMMKEVHGAYSIVVLTEDKLIAVRDPYGVRPLCIGALSEGSYIVASESCALNVLGAKLLREVGSGEMVTIDETGMHSRQAIPAKKSCMCIFEFIYFARPDSHIYGRSVHQVRRRMGHELAREHPVDADLVIPIPDTGIPAAIGFSEASRIPYSEGVIKSRYIHRTFIQPDQRMREMGVRMKLAPLTENLSGKRVVMVDDSIVRGTTTGPTVKMLRDAGAREVHVRITAAPYKYPCFYGIDTANRAELVASKKSVEEIRQQIGADSLGFLSTAGLIRAVGGNPDEFCMACFDGDYPIEVPEDMKVSKFSLENKE